MLMSLDRSVLFPATFLLLLAISFEVLATVAAPPQEVESCAMAFNDINPDGDVSPRFTLTVRYPDGRRRTYAGSSIPSSVGVLTGEEVILRAIANVKYSGDYQMLARAASNVDIPPNVRISLGTTTTCRGSDGYILGEARVTFPDYFDGASAKLEIYTVWRDNVRHTTIRIRRVVQVELRALPTSMINPHPTFTNLGSGTSTTTTASAETSGSSSGSGPGGVNWITSTTRTGNLRVDPSSQEVEAGGMATFTLITTLDSPRFRLPGMPADLRYTVTGENGTYLLRLKTSPSSGGTYRVRIEAISGNAVESGIVLLKVLRGSTTEGASTSAHSPATRTPNASNPHTGQVEVGGTAPSPTAPAPATSSQEPVTKFVTKVRKGDSLLLPAMGFTVVVLLLILLLLLRSR